MGVEASPNDSGTTIPLAIWRPRTTKSQDKEGAAARKRKANAVSPAETRRAKALATLNKREQEFLGMMMKPEFRYAVGDEALYLKPGTLEWVPTVIVDVTEDGHVTIYGGTEGPEVCLDKVTQLVRLRPRLIPVHVTRPS